MRRGVFFVALCSALVGIPLGGCAIVSGVDQFQKGDCAGGSCGDAQMMLPDGATKPDGSSQADGAMDSTTMTDSTGGTDTSTSDAPGIETGPDGGCGPLNTVQNCSMCGATCDTTHSNSPSCNGTTCQYQSCQMGYANCSTTAPDTDGCECNTPACCGNQCQTVHQNGLGKDWYDCVAQGTFNLVQAIQACTAYTGNQNACNTTQCVNPKDDLVCGSFNNKCACWDYNGQTPGHVDLSGNSQCYCPGAMDPSWN